MLRLVEHKDDKLYDIRKHKDDQGRPYNLYDISTCLKT